MRPPLHLVRYFVIVLALCVASHAYADDRSDARTHYQTAAKLYSGGDYRGAIREFSAAQQLVPADLNNYNLALCYDKLGDAEPAIQYYRAFLDKQPNTDKRAEIEASVNRLDAAVKSAATKKADEARRADDAKRKADDDANRPVLGPAVPGPDAAAAAPAGPTLGPAPGPEAEQPRKPKHRGPAVAGSAVSGSIGTPSNGTAVASGDAQLDRVNGMSIDEIRDQRMGGTASQGGPGTPQGQGQGQLGQGQPGAGQGQYPQAQGQYPQGQGQYPQGQQPPTGVVGPTGNGDEPKKESPVYKKWWFWAVVAVGGYVVYELATTSSSSSNGNGFSAVNGRTVNRPSGLTLLRW